MGTTSAGSQPPDSPPRSCTTVKPNFSAPAAGPGLLRRISFTHKSSTGAYPLDSLSPARSQVPLQSPQGHITDLEASPRRTRHTVRPGARSPTVLSLVSPNPNPTCIRAQVLHSPSPPHTIGKPVPRINPVSSAHAPLWGPRRFCRAIPYPNPGLPITKLFGILRRIRWWGKVPHAARVVCAREDMRSRGERTVFVRAISRDESYDPENLHTCGRDMLPRVCKF